MINVVFDRELSKHINSIDVHEDVLDTIVDTSGIKEVRDKELHVVVGWESPKGKSVGGTYDPLDDFVTVYLNGTPTLRNGVSYVAGHELSHAKRRKSQLIEGLSVVVGIPTMMGVIQGTATGIRVDKQLETPYGTDTAVAIGAGAVSGVLLTTLMIGALYCINTVGGSRIIQPIGEWQAHRDAKKYINYPDFLTYTRIS